MIVVARERAGELAFAEHEHAVGEAHDLGQIRGREHDGVAARRQLLDQRVDLGLRADIDAAGRLVEQEHARRELEPLADHDLLLIAAGEGRDLGAETRHLDGEIAKT